MCIKKCAVALRNSDKIINKFFSFLLLADYHKSSAASMINYDLEWKHTFIRSSKPTMSGFDDAAAATNNAEITSNPVFEESEVRCNVNIAYRSILADMQN